MSHITTLQRLFFLTFCSCCLLFVDTAMAKKDNFKIKTDSLELPRTSSGARNLSSGDDVEIIPLGEAEFTGHCKYRGHVGKYQCKKVSAIKGERYSCKGKGVYYSKVGGKKYCYTCPKGYTRFSPTRKMNHKKACTKRKPGKNDYAKAAKRVKNVDGCGKSKFKHKGFCKSCPVHTKRGFWKTATGIDDGKCKVEKAYRCNAGLTLHKSAPKNIWDRARNWAGLKHKKFCGLPFNFVDYGKEIVQSEANKQSVQGVINLGEALANATGATKTKVENIEKAINDKNLEEAYELLTQFPEFEALKADLAASGDAFEQSVAERGKFAITVGFVVDGSIFLGGNYEIGLAYNVANNSLKLFSGYGLTKGASMAVDGAINVGIWKGDFVDSYTQGYTIEAPIISLGYAVGAGVGIGVWSDYYTPKRADGLNQPHFVGLSGSFGVGSGFQFGEYSEVWTDVHD